MPSIKDLKRRIGSVKNTQQTTRAMKMVSAAKLRRAQEAIQNHRPYALRLGSLMRQLAAIADAPKAADLMARETGDGGKRVLLLLVTSDRGLCGAFNGSVIKTAQRWMRDNASAYASIELGFLGRKGYDFFKTKKVGMGTYHQELGGKVTFAKARQLSAALLEDFRAGKYDEVKVIYNEFKNAATQQVVVEDFLPLAFNESDASEAQTPIAGAIIRPGAAEVLEQLIAKNFPVQAFRIMLESQAGEHGARMSSMENATKNAGEMIRKLTLQYNKQRQAGITKELLEIISGSESQKASA
jgi:F-type H+-transporting ATPase subunit gamma